MNKEDYEYIYDMDESDLVSLYKYIGAGSSRRVYAINNEVVIKFAYSEMGDRQNATEWQVYKNANERERQILAPVFDMDAGDRMLIMERANPVNQSHD